MWDLIILASLTLIFSIALIDHYASPGTPILIRLLAVVSFWLGFGGIVLLPLDLSRTRDVATGDDDLVIDDDTAQPQQVNHTYTPWMVTYWSTFALAWLVLPFVREVLYSGYFSWTARVKNGGRTYAIAHVIMGALALVLVLALTIHLKNWRVVKPILMALANTYGLLLVSLLLGYGLVDVPRRLWRKAKPELELRRTQIMATAADEALFEAVWELQDCEDAIDSAVQASKNNNHDGESNALFVESQQQQHSIETMPYEDCVNELLRLRNLTSVLDAELESRRTKRPNTRTAATTTTTPTEHHEVRPTIDELAQLNARFKLAQANLVSTEQRWMEILQTHVMYSQLVQLDDADQPWPTKDDRDTTLTAQYKYTQQLVRYLWMTKLRRVTFPLLAISAAALSATVLWTEATMVLPFNVSPFAVALELFDEDHLENSYFFIISALVPLLYMSACVYTTLFKVSFFGPNCLRGWKQSPGVALIFNAQYLIRMQFSLGYNYLLMLKIDTSSTNCAFSKVMSDMSTVPFLGTSFSIYAPLCIGALCVFTLYNGYSRLLGLLGIQHEDSILMGDRETLDSQVNEGIVLLERNVRRQENRKLNTNRGGGVVVLANSNNGVGGGSENEDENSNWWYNVVV